MQHTIETAGSLGEDRETRFLGVGDEVLSDAGEGLIPQIEVYGFGRGGLKILFYEVFCFCQIAYHIGEDERPEGIP